MATDAEALNLSLSWDPNSESDLAGYRLYYGYQSGAYDFSVDVGKRTSYVLSSLQDGRRYYLAMTAYNSRGMESGFSNEVEYVPQSTNGAPFKMEVGETTADHNWKRVGLTKSFSNPIVIVKSISRNGPEPAELRMRNVGPTGFEVRVQEWDYLDGTHTQEEIGYLVIERGTYTLNDGTRVEAGRLSSSATGVFERFGFQQAFNKVPVVIAAVSTFNGGDAVTVRLGNVKASGFAYEMQEQESYEQAHTSETISYVAWEPSDSVIDGVACEVARGGNSVDDQPQQLRFNQVFAQQPVFLADMQTTYGPNTAALRWQNRGISQIEIMVEEEQSLDEETNHAAEVVGYMAFAKQEAAKDSDQDGLSDSDERLTYGTDPYNRDTDGDGIEDGEEVVFWGNDWKADFDGDGTVNLLDKDADGDGLADGYERNANLSPGVSNLKVLAGLGLEIGEVELDHNWKRVAFRKPFSDPIVVATPLSYNGADPAVLRMRNIDAIGFEIRIQEWNYLDGRHTLETVGFVVAERGTYTLPDGTHLEAGKFETDAVDAFVALRFAGPFRKTPVVATSVVTYNGPDAVSGRLRNVSKAAFEYCMQEQEANTDVHTYETICYIACEPSTGKLADGTVFEVGRTPEAVFHSAYGLFFQPAFMDSPVFIAGMQTANGMDTANLRWENKDILGVDILVDEEQSADSETSHTTEAVGYMAFSYPTGGR
jgi:hypothetical protein